MSEDSIFIVKVEQNLRDFENQKHLYCLLFMYVSFGEEKKRQK